ncbi:TrmH family RNA methyltransferase [Hyphobacterium marinum]|uniref:RNA methyltransferase n=1 Tax=Hyphobacterium marinum TaxID=3116574 RepID=A0ABU7M1N7_9PROT|nr:RNA methyltransferase [Hyphobacterium sp. Y6023]MEE2567711.1 RNA methyltransferase [Hyphobacterium sp. Y6023]
MTKPEQRNRSRTPYNKGHSDKSASPEEGWIWGRHAVLAALANPRRKVLKVLATRNAARDLPEGTAFDETDPKDIDRLLPDGAVHQGFAIRARAPEEDRLSSVADPTHGVLLVFDQITDPHNAGAIFRSAAAFGARAVIMQDRKSPPLFGAMAKAAVGAAEVVPAIRVVNIANALAELRDAGRFVIGLAGEAEDSLPDLIEAHGGPGLVIVLGAEDKGLRPRVADHCDALGRIPTTGKVESLNVSNAAAVALYSAHMKRLSAQAGKGG